MSTPGRGPTQLDVARRAGVSRALVSLVVRGSDLVREDKRQAVLAAIEELGYRANAVGQLLASKRPSMIGLVSQSLRNPFYGELIEGIHLAAQEHALRVLIETCHGRPDQERSAIEALLDLRVAGLALVAPTSSDDDIQALAAVTPLVVLGRDVPSVDCVAADEHAGGALVAAHLLARGHRHLVYLDAAPDQRSWSTRQRGLGFGAAVAAAGGRVRVVSCTAEGTPPAIDVLLGSTNPEPATAVFAYNDVAAAGAERLLRAAGVRIPREVALVGYDDTVLAGVGLGLTSVDQGSTVAGAVAMELLLERLAGRTEPVRRMLTPRLVVRDSS